MAIITTSDEFVKRQEPPVKGWWFERVPMTVEEQAAALAPTLEKQRELAAACFLTCRFRVQANSELYQYWQENPPGLMRDTTIELDPELLPGRNIIHINTFTEGEGTPENVNPDTA